MMKSIAPLLTMVSAAQKVYFEESFPVGNLHSIQRWDHPANEYLEKDSGLFYPSKGNVKDDDSFYGLYANHDGPLGRYAISSKLDEPLLEPSKKTLTL